MDTGGEYDSNDKKRAEETGRGLKRVPEKKRKRGRCANDRGRKRVNGFSDVRKKESSGGDEERPTHISREGMDARPN